jgi:hypothetical protein
LIDDNVEKKAEVKKAKADVGKKAGQTKTDTGKAKALHKK